MPALDNTVNFGRVTVLAGHNASDTSIALQSGNGALLPVAPFNVVWWNSAAYADPSQDPNKEIVRVTAGGGGGGGDTLTVIRNQEGSGASTKNTAGGIYQMVACPTAKVFNTDIYNAFGSAFFGRMNNPTFPKAYINSTANGNNDVYTVPANRVALVYSIIVANFGVNNPNFYPQIKSGGTYYPLVVAVSVGASPANAAASQVPVFLLQAGEILSLHADAVGMSAWFTVIEFDSATTNINRGFITSLSNGNNTLYTVPAGKTSRVMPRFGPVGASAIASGAIQIYNASGGALTYTFYAVPNGGSTGVTNEFNTSVGIANNAGAGAILNGNLGAGDFIVVNTSGGGATQTAWCVMIEN